MSEGAPLYIVDGFNVLHAVVLRGRDRSQWWSAENQRKVCELALDFSEGEVWVVFDAGRRHSERCEAPEGLSLHFAPHADDWIVDRARELDGIRPLYVVSSDRPLLDRARQYGAHRLSPWEFRSLCEDGAAEGPSD